MAKLLRVLVIVLLVLSIGALTLGIMLFNKRELLKIRTQKLENALIAVGYTIEDQDPEDPADTFPAKDISPVGEEVITDPQRSEFWETYRQELEVTDLEKMNLKQRKEALKSYFKRDPATGQPVTDPATGRRITQGPGTMEAVLSDLLANAEDQLARLNATRQELVETRKELTSTITDLNNRKKDLREANAKIVDLENTISDLEGTVADQKALLKQRQSQIEDLEARVAQKDRRITQLEEQVKEQELKYDDLEKKYIELREKVKTGEVTEDDTRVVERKAVSPGKKGTIAAVDSKYHFVAIEVTEEFVTELFKNREEDAAGVPNIELVVKRPGKEKKYVTKVRLVQIRKEEKIAVADVLTNWQQLPVKQGDVVYY
jgi:uncharacterized coiled-coil protein SlyX